MGRVKPQIPKAKKARGVGKATNLGGFGAGKTPKTESKESAGGWEGNQPGGDLRRVKPQKTKAKKAQGGWEGNQPGGILGRVKPQKPKAKKARGVGKATNLGGFGAGKTPKTESKESPGGWEGNQSGGIWGG